MKLFYRFLSLILCVVLFCFSCATEPIDDVSNIMEISLEKKEVKAIELEILDLINAHRVDVGLNALLNMAVVKSVAYSHTDYMINENEVSHHNFFTRSEYLKLNAGAIKVSENVAYGYSSAQSVVRAWMKSAAHKKNLEGDYTYFDVSAEKNKEGTWYYTNIFMKK